MGLVPFYCAASGATAAGEHAYVGAAEKRPRLADGALSASWELKIVSTSNCIILYLHSRGLVLICMDSYDSESRRIFQHFRDLQD